MSNGPEESHNSEKHTLRIRFERLTIAAANQAARELEQFLRPLVGPDGSIEIVKTDETTMNMGATLILVLGTPVAVAIAKGVRDYIAKRGTRVVIETRDGRIVATGDAAKNIDVAKAAAAITKPI